MNPRAVKVLKIILPLFLGVFLIWYSISSSSPEERIATWNAISTANPFWVIASIVMGLVSHLSRAYRWKFLLNPMGYSIRMSNSFMAIMAGYLANLGIPRSGEIIRAGIVASYEDIPFKKGIGTVISERVVDFIMLALIIIIAIVFQSQPMFSYFGEKITDPFISLGALLLLILLGVLFLRLLKHSNHKFLVKIRDFGEGILEGVKSIYYMKKKGAFVFHTLLIWILYVLMFYVIKYTIPETYDLSIGPLLVTFVAGSLAMSLTNGGVGAFPLAIAYSLLLFDIDESAGKAFGWILWGSQTIINVVVGLLSFLFLPIINRKNS